MRSTRIRKLVHKYKLGLLVLAPLSALLLTIGIGCGHEPKPIAKAQDDDVLMVSTTTPKKMLLRRYIKQPGMLKSYEETPIYSKLPGYMETVKVDIGDRITKDELLGELWVPEVEEAVKVKESFVRKGKADVIQAEENLKVAKADIVTCEAKVDEMKASVIRAVAFVDRWDKEYERDKVSKVDPNDPMKGFLNPKTVAEIKKQLDAAKAALKETEAAVASATAALKESIAKREKAAADLEVSKTQLVVWERELEYQKRWFEYARIKAPYDGIVTRRIVHTGHFVQPANSGTTNTSAEPLFVVMRTDIVRVVVPVPEYDAPLVRDGADAIVRLQAYPGQEIKCKVTRSSWALDHDSRTDRVELFLDNPDWYTLTEKVFMLLRNAKVPDPVLAKLKPLQAKDFNQKDFVTEIAKCLNADEMKQFSDVILKRAANQKLQAGMYANIIITADIPNTLCLEAEAILTDGNKQFCYFLEDGKARRLNVRVGITNEAMTEVLMKQMPPTKVGAEGAWVNFTGNEQVITSNLKSIQDGQPARAKSAIPANGNVEPKK
jgi:multidrug resistance efflux pump